MKPVFICLAIIPFYTFSQQTDSLEWFIQKQVTDYRMPALAIGVIENNKIVYSRGFGLMDDNKVSPETVFPIMSCTKAFTATAIGILVDEGKLKWEDKVIRFLPGFRLSDPAVTKQLTIADILSHRSGLESFEGDLLWYGTDYTREEIMRRIRYSPVKNKYRKEYGYQNVMYLAAGQVIEKITGIKWEEFVKERIFTPLEMDSTRTTGYLYNIAPAGAIHSNINDMLTWLGLWMNNGNFNGKQLISKNTVDAITTRHIYISDNKAESYGLGWQIESGKNNKVISHGGGMPGYKSLITIDIKNKRGVVILTNKITYLNEELSGIILEYLNAGRMNWSEKDKNLLTKNIRFGWDENKNNYHPAVPEFDEYTGTYEDRQYGRTKIKKHGDTAIIEFLPAIKQYKGYLTYLKKDTLHIDFSDPFIPSGNLVFRRKNNRITGFTFDIPPGDFIFSNFKFEREN